MYKFLPLILLLTSCRYGAGVAVRPTSLDNQTIDMANPSGVIRVENNINNFQIYYEHISSIPDGNEDGGLNFFGINYMFELK